MIESNGLYELPFEEVPVEDIPLPVLVPLSPLMDDNSWLRANRLPLFKLLPLKPDGLAPN